MHTEIIGKLCVVCGRGFEEHPNSNKKMCPSCNAQLMNTNPGLSGITWVKSEHDTVNHPAHYCSHPSGIECIQVTEHMSFNIGNVVKYCWRAGEKGPALEDLRKAAWYLNREIERLTKEAK